MQAKESFKQGDVVKRKLANSGILVGSYKLIDDVERFGVYAHAIPINSLGSLWYKKSEIAKVPQITLTHNDKEIQSVINDRLDWIQHPVNKSWNKALLGMKNLSVVILKSTKTSIIVTEPTFRMVHEGNKIFVKMTFVRILDEIVK